MKRRIVPVALALCLALALLSLGARAAETGPAWGTEVQWSYDEDTYRKRPHAGGRPAL